jgi:hypothetical protein
MLQKSRRYNEKESATKYENVYIGHEVREIVTSQVTTPFSRSCAIWS